MSRNAGKLKPYAFSFAGSNSLIYDRDNQMSLRGLLLKYQKLWVLYPFRKPHCWFEKMLSKKVDNLANLRFSKTFDNVGRILTGLKFSFISFLPFLCMVVTSGNFKEEGKLEDLIALFMLVHKKSANISIFPW